MPRISGQVTPEGALVDVYIGYSRSDLIALDAAQQGSRKTLRVRALIDTGASMSSIDVGIASELGLIPTGVEEILTPSTGAASHLCNAYKVRITIGDPSDSARTEDITVFEADLHQQNFEVLLGRDVLSGCLLFYDGPGKSFVLTF